MGESAGQGFVQECNIVITIIIGLVDCLNNVCLLFSISLRVFKPEYWTWDINNDYCLHVKDMWVESWRCLSFLNAYLLSI